MHDAAEHGLIDIAELLKEHGIGVDDEDKVRTFFLISVVLCVHRMVYDHFIMHAEQAR